jgi:hypothetical protein
MANINRKVVTIPVHKEWFDKIYEPERKRLAARFGKNNLSHSKFTEFMAKTNVQFKAPPINNKLGFKIKRNGGFEFKLDI